MFTFNPEDYSGSLARNSYIYIQGGCEEGFMKQLEEYVFKIKSENVPNSFSFKPTGDDEEELFRTFKIMTDVERLTVSRHHVLYYRKNMPSYPHKDRKSLQYSCAIGIENTKQSSLFLWPKAPLDENTGSHWRDYVESKGGQEIINKETQANEPVEFSTERGDVIFFPGSRMYHHRSNTEDVIIYYVAVNEYGLYDRPASRQERKNPGKLAPPPPDLIK